MRKLEQAMHSSTFAIKDCIIALKATALSFYRNESEQKPRAEASDSVL